MTYRGGSKDSGTIFNFNPSNNTENLLWNFGNIKGDGANPTADLNYYTGTGLFYGTTFLGGNKDDGGTIYSFNPVSKAENVVWNFGGGKGDGQNPGGNLIYNIETGLFYAMTFDGGPSPYFFGTIISFNPNTNAEDVVWNFNGYPSDGSGPNGSLVAYTPTSGINNLNVTQISTINIYPNPSGQEFTISALHKGEISDIYNYLGEKVSSTVVEKKIMLLNISTQTDGIYLVTIHNSDGTLIDQKQILKTN